MGVQKYQLVILLFTIAQSCGVSCRLCFLRSRFGRKLHKLVLLMIALSVPFAFFFMTEISNGEEQKKKRTKTEQ